MELNNYKVYLWGMPGAGKSTIGKKIAHKLNIQFIDLDKVIEKTEQRSIPEIFSSSGEEYFRKIEANCLKSLDDSAAIVATGGGAPCFLDNAEYMLQNGFCVFLDAPMALLSDRLIDSIANRPLIEGLNSKSEIQNKLQSLYNERIAHYNKAQFKVLSHHADLNLLLNAINDWFNSEI